MSREWHPSSGRAPAMPVGVQAQLVAAARARRLVELVDGRLGQIVYAPSDRRTATRTPRHGDATQCGVRFLNGPRDRIDAVPVVDIVRIFG